jgi:hypothetical protein
MARKEHLSHTYKGGPACQNGRVGASLRGEHIAVKYSEFSKLPVELRCERCNNGKLFSFLERQTAKALLAA